MQKISYRLLIPVIALIATVAMASCTANKKYGCPNKLSIPSVISVVTR